MYHPKSEKAKTMQDSFQQTIKSPPREPELLQMENHKGSKLKSQKLTVAYHHTPNLGELLLHCKFVDNDTPFWSIWDNEKVWCHFQQPQPQPQKQPLD